MRTLSLSDTQRVAGGDPITTTVLAAALTWVWANRSALNEIAQSAASTAADLNAECGD